MPETKTIPSTTIVTINVVDIDITSLCEDGGSGMWCDIVLDDVEINGTDFISGHGAFVSVPDGISVSVNQDGHLIMSDSSGDASRFYISDGILKEIV